MFSMNKVPLVSRVANTPTGALLGILLIAVILRLLFFVGMARTDDYGYAQAAYNLANGVYRVSGFNLHHQARLAIVVPLATSFRLFGVNEYSAELWPLLCSLGSIVVIFYLGKLVFDERTGFIAAVLLSFFPLEVVYSTQLLPDVILPFFLALSVLCFLKGHRTSNRAASCAWFCLSWVFVGLAFFTRESGVVILLFYIAYIVYNRTLRKEYLAAGALVAAFSLVIGLIYLRMQGNPLAGLQYISDLIHFGTVRHLQGITRYFLKTWLDYPRMVTTDPPFVYFTAVTAIAFVYLLRRNGKHLYVPALWLLTLFLYLEVLSSLHYMERLDRYLTIVTTPALLIVARFLVVVAARKREGVVHVPLLHRIVVRIVECLEHGWVAKRAICTAAIYWGGHAIATSLLLASILFSPSFVREYLSPDGILQAKTVSMIQKIRLTAFGSGTILAMALLISRKWGRLRMLGGSAGILAKMVIGAARQLDKFGHGRLMVGFLIGFLCVTSIPQIAVGSRNWRHHTSRYREAGHLLSSVAGKDIHLPDTYWLRRLNFYLGFDTGYDMYGTPQENSDSILKPLPEIGLEQIEDAYVVTDQRVWENGEWFLGEELRVPDWWQELARITYQRGDTVIYYTGNKP